MRHYHQHIIVLFSVLLKGGALIVLNVVLARWLNQLVLLGLIAATLLVVGQQVIRWYSFSVRIEGRQVLIRDFRGFVVNERIVSLNAPGGTRLRQNLLGWLLDYGTLQIAVFGEPIRVAYLTPFRALQRQIDAV